MTRKFWNDWKQRIDETKKIIGWCEEASGKCKCSLIGLLPFKILSAKFNNDTVDLVLELEFDIVDENGWHTRFENKNFTLNRVDIATVEFKIY